MHSYLLKTLGSLLREMFVSQTFEKGREVILDALFDTIFVLNPHSFIFNFGNAIPVSSLNCIRVKTIAVTVPKF